MTIVIAKDPGGVVGEGDLREVALAVMLKRGASSGWVGHRAEKVSGVR